MSAEHAIRYDSKSFTVFFDMHARYVRIKADEGCGGHVYGLKWETGEAVIKEGENGHPIWGLDRRTVRSLTKENVKVTRLVKACRTFSDGTPSAYAPNKIHDSLALFLKDRPLSAMGHALALASAGPTSRARHAGFISEAFGTVDHPFRGIENGKLEEAIRIAYSGYAGLSTNVMGHVAVLSTKGNCDHQQHQRAWSNILEMQKDSLPGDNMIGRNTLRFTMNCVKNAKVRAPLKVVVRA